MEPHTHNQLRLTAIIASRLLQTRKRFEKISKRLKLWMSSTHLVHPHSGVQNASNDSVESTSSAEDPLLTRLASITCRSNAINDDLTLVPLPPNSHFHVRDDGGKNRDGEIFRDKSKLELAVPENDHIALQCHPPNASEEPEISKDSSTVLAGPSDTSSSPLNMWYQSAETVEASDCIDKVRSQDANLFVNVVLCDVSSAVINTSEAKNSDQDTGLCIVITPPEDNWENSWYTAYNNRIGPQYLTCLVVPPFYLFTSRLIKYEEWMSICYLPAGTVSYDQSVAKPSRTSAGPLTSSPSRSQKHFQDPKSDSYDATALQRDQLKAVAFTASVEACLFRIRYDTPEFLENIEPRFNWVDPAEILIESFRHDPQSVTIYTSHRPCSVPHIAIHESPSNDPYVVWNNSSNFQDCCLLGTPSPNPSLQGRDDCLIVDKCLSDIFSSTCDSVAPVTPKDFSSTCEQDLDMFFDEDEIQHSDHIYGGYEDEFVVPQYSKPQSKDTTSRFFIPDDEDDDEDSLPPLDDWYLAIANRCMPPEQAVAVAAAAAAMPTSRH